MTSLSEGSTVLTSVTMESSNINSVSNSSSWVGESRNEQHKVVDPVEHLLVLEWIVSSYLRHSDSAPLLPLPFLQKCKAVIINKLLDSQNLRKAGVSANIPPDQCNANKALGTFADITADMHSPLPNDATFVKGFSEQLLAIQAIIELLMNIIKASRDFIGLDGAVDFAWLLTLTIRLKLFFLQRFMFYISDMFLKNFKNLRDIINGASSVAKFLGSQNFDSSEHNSQESHFSTIGAQHSVNSNRNDQIDTCCPLENDMGDDQQAVAITAAYEMDTVTAAAGIIPWDKVLLLLQNEAVFKWVCADDPTEFVQDIEFITSTENRQKNSFAFATSEILNKIAEQCRAVGQYLLPQLESCHFVASNYFSNNSAQSNKVKVLLNKCQWISQTVESHTELQGLGRLDRTKLGAESLEIAEGFSYFVNREHCDKLMGAFFQLSRLCQDILPKPYFSQLLNDHIDSTPHLSMPFLHADPAFCEGLLSPYVAETPSSSHCVAEIPMLHHTQRIVEEGETLTYSLTVDSSSLGTVSPISYAAIQETLRALHQKRFISKLQKRLHSLYERDTYTDASVRAPEDIIEKELSHQATAVENLSFHPIGSVVWEALWTLLQAVAACSQFTAFVRSIKWKSPYSRNVLNNAVTAQKLQRMHGIKKKRKQHSSPSLSLSDALAEDDGSILAFSSLDDAISVHCSSIYMPPEHLDEESAPSVSSHALDKLDATTVTLASPLIEYDSESASIECDGTQTIEHKDEHNLLFERQRYLRSDGKRLMDTNPTSRRIRWDEDSLSEMNMEYVRYVTRSSIRNHHAQKSIADETFGRRWSSQQVEELIQLVNCYGIGNWKTMQQHSQYVSKKSPAQLKDKWRNMQLYKHVTVSNGRFVRSR